MSKKKENLIKRKKRSLIRMKGVVISEIVDNWIEESRDREDELLDGLVEDRMDYINRISKCSTLEEIKKIFFDCLWSDREMFEERWKELL